MVSFFVEAGNYVTERRSIQIKIKSEGGHTVSDSEEWTNLMDLGYTENIIGLFAEKYPKIGSDARK